MTYLEKARELNPNLAKQAAIKNYCPDDFKLAESSDLRETSCLANTCTECWNREMPNKTEEETKL